MHYVFYNNMATQEDITKVLNEVKSRLATGRMTATDMVNGLSAAKGQPNATELTSTPAYTPPKTDTTYTSSNTASSLLDQQIKNLEAQQKQASDFMSANGGSGSNSYEQLINMQSNAPTVNVAGYADQLKTQYGTTDLLNKLKEQNVKVASIQGDIQKLGTAELAEIDTAEGRVASRGAIEGEKETIARKYNIAKAYKNAELYAEAAVAQAYQGNLTEANNMINQAVEYYTYDKKAEIDRFDKLFTVASDWVKSLTNQEQNLLTAKREELVRQNEETKADKKGVLELSLQYPSAGISITDSVEQATMKATESARKQAELEASETTIKELSDGRTVAIDKYGNIVSVLSGAGGGNEDAVEQLYTGLKSTTATAVRAKVGAFKSETMVTNFSTIQDGYNFAKSISSTTTNPADDQALIYSLAKALDPSSVVREGEYATAQKYAQSWVSAYGKGVSQALAGTGFLSTKARENIKKVIEAKYLSSKKSYDNVYKQYIDGINSLTGRNDGSKFIVDYSTTNTTDLSTISNEDFYGLVSGGNDNGSFWGGGVYQDPNNPNASILIKK
jgi:dsDNA-binding SOS-regulon protein